MLNKYLHQKASLISALKVWCDSDQ